MVLPISLTTFQNQSYGNHMSEFEVDFMQLVIISRALEEDLIGSPFAIANYGELS